ncbi:MAG: HNH endonuclease [Actinoplanes sp.]
MQYVNSSQGGVDRREVMWEWNRINTGDAIWLYAADPYQTICGMARIVQVNPVHNPPSIDLIWDADVCQALTERPIPWSGQAAPRRPGLELKEPMLSTVVTWLEQHHLGVGAWHESGDDDLAENDARVRAAAWTVLRPGQQAFRQLLLQHYRTCVVTGEPLDDVLDAAHVAPFNGPQSDVLENGLLLRTDIHRLFDRHLFSFENGRVVIGPPLLGTSYERLPAQILHSAMVTSVASHRLLGHLARFRRLFPS